MLLTIDAGNTRTKWGLFDEAGAMLEHGACLNTNLEKMQVPAVSRVIISNVAGEKVKTQLEKILANNTQTNVQIKWLSAQASACGIINHYEKPETLGSDRWAALIAAWHIKQASCVVVNAGTAVTIDALSVADQHSQAAFIGGVILPGLTLIRQSLASATAQLPAKLQETSVQKTPLQELLTQPQNVFAKNTADAIHAGSLLAISGAIILMERALNTQCKQAPVIVISGGDAQLIKDSLNGSVTNSVIIIDNLVLQGLYLLEKLMPPDI